VRLTFADYVLDTASRQLFRGEQEVPLSPKALQLLQALLESRPRALSKAELRVLLWPDAAVTDANLSNLVGDIRSALQDDPRSPRFVRTVPRFGYAFCDEPAPTGSAAPAGLRVRLRWPGGSADLGPGEHLVGRDADVPICLVSGSVSRRHALVRVSAGQATLEDLGSKNGTWLNGERVGTPRELADGDDVRAGSVRLGVRLRRAPASTETGPGRGDGD
jgi:DNA-binding winged helix-turn-helix (wHTH) protein